MKILVTKDAPIAGTDWPKGTILEAPAKAAQAALDAGHAATGEALEKALKAAAPKAKAKKSAKSAPTQSTQEEK